MTVAGYQAKDATGNDTFLLTWTTWQLSIAARPGCWVGNPTYTSIYGLLTVANLGGGLQRLPWPAELEGWSIWQGSTPVAGYVAGLTLGLSRAYDTVLLDSFAHTPNTNVDRPLAITVAAGETFAIRSNDPGQGTNPIVQLTVNLWGSRI